MRTRQASYMALLLWGWERRGSTGSIMSLPPPQHFEVAERHSTIKVCHLRGLLMGCGFVVPAMPQPMTTLIRDPTGFLR